ncbi:hypothetical protein [Piscinibacter koreensis]|uniref:Uncharacterized protein n=1 Tax=Piscinibacter koreensis TaxID=2742824 RepID=A0A7Y6NTD7_9BURK|nr:hypothetical protein [Schlegelella koreensis]NUZ08980.1 hypothetical protein [Schlegelella koreensis]
MKAVHSLAAVAALTLASEPAIAQFVRGNEAHKALPNGSRSVETPPLTAAASRRTACQADAGCHAGSWHMVETAGGLQECTEAYARPGTCRASSYGSVKRSRLWVVKSGGKWLQCQYPDLGSKCVDMFARPPANLPFDAVQ